MNTKAIRICVSFETTSYEERKYVIEAERGKENFSNKEYTINLKATLLDNEYVLLICFNSRKISKCERLLKSTDTITAL